MVKIHILGGPGSGKTTLASSLASGLGIPHYDLDQLARKHGTQAAPYIEDTIAIMQQPGWVTEGIYLLFVDMLLEQADAIVVLDISWPQAAWRILRRHTIKSFRGTNLYPGFKPLFNLLQYARSYYLNKRPDTVEAVRLYVEDQVTPPSLPTAASMLVNLEKHSSLVIPPTAAFVRQYLEPYQEKLVLVKNNAESDQLLKRFVTK